MGGFTLAEAAYLESLPAVDRVDAVHGRIHYSRDFKRHVAIAYRRGESPTVLFRQAGLDPLMVGYKRIERAVAHWREDRSLLSGVDGFVPVGGWDGLLGLSARVSALESRVGGLESREADR
ncbi:transposase [Bifidobacterium miconisargentati]|uniref:transposase n=1 Tax=Bifidobacterium miconisargentati TaxID=2834437 RepID=UPI001BDD0610|nr:transposase [Bifidobacterium miconisargentati]MBW3089253.1 transposase [Bifidobacterium miconisargentati]